MEKNLSFIETIKITDGIVRNFKFHMLRILQTASAYHFVPPTLSIQQLESKNPYQYGVIKCRILYSASELQIEYTPYRQRTIERLKVVDCDTIRYPFKYANRQSLEQLTQQCDPSDEIIILKGGAVTDTSFSNILFRKDQKLYTPSTYLLNGTQRRRLLYDRTIQSIPISLQDIHRFDSILLINAMMDLDDAIELSCDRIIFSE